MDIAINKGYVSMVRCLELRSFFTGTLQLKVGSPIQTAWLIADGVVCHWGFHANNFDHQDTYAAVAFAHAPC